jgi:hypothetical protein
MKREIADFAVIEDKVWIPMREGGTNTGNILETWTGSKNENSVRYLHESWALGCARSDCHARVGWNIVREDQFPHPPNNTI